MDVRINNIQTAHSGSVYSRDYVIDYTSLERDDLIGNTPYYTKANGQSYAELTYDAWGMPESPNKLLNNDHGNYVYATYTGHIFDTTLDIYFAEARFYDTNTRTWLAMDPIKDGGNWYQYCYSNPLKYWDPTGLFADGFFEYGCSVVDDVIEAVQNFLNVTELEAQRRIRENRNNIIASADKFGLDPKMVAIMIYTEQANNYDFKDVLADSLLGRFGIDMSIGIGQVRVSTAERIENAGYMPQIILPYNIPVIGRFIERQVRISKLKNPATNIDYVAGLVKNIVNNWETDYPEIVESPDIVWTIYNTGNNFDTPHSNPKPGALADFALENYDLMGKLLYD